MKLYLLILGFLIATACTATIVPYEEAKDVPPERKHAIFADTDGIEVGIVRDLGGRGSWYDIIVAVDGLRAATLEPGERVVLSLSPGEHRLEVWSPDHKTLTQELIVVMEGVPLHYRLSVAGMGVTFIPYPL